MSALFTLEDVARWENNAVNDIPFQLEALKKPQPPDHRRQRYGHLAGDYKCLAMIAIARGNFGEVRELLRKSFEMRFESYEILLAQGEAISAGSFQEVLLALVTADQPLISRMLDYYRWEKGVPESVFMGKIIKSLAQGDISVAQATLSEKRPRIEKMFAAYPECLHAIAHKDDVSFQKSIAVASNNWEKWVSKHENGLPTSVCFLQGVGLVRLAERVIGRKLSIDVKNIPPELIA